MIKFEEVQVVAVAVAATDPATERTVACEPS